MKQYNNLNNAKYNVDDEFYTQMKDIDSELKHYVAHFKDKVIYLNCDSMDSKFVEHFIVNHVRYRFKKLIATHYNPNGSSYSIEFDGNSGSGSLFNSKVTITPLKGDGDFRSDECIEFLRQCDIVVSNPPFSLFSEYVAQLNAVRKSYLIIGNFNAVTYRDIFPLIKRNKLWLGVSPRTMAFIRPTGELRTVNACWFTNLEHDKRNKFIHLTNDCGDFIKYDNYDAIEVSKVKDIPIGYTGVMGVPISFLDKYNPEQFEILSQATWAVQEDDNIGYLYINGQKKYARFMIRFK